MSGMVGLGLNPVVVAVAVNGFLNLKFTHRELCLWLSRKIQIQNTCRLPALPHPLPCGLPGSEQVFSGRHPPCDARVRPAPAALQGRCPPSPAALGEPRPHTRFQERLSDLAAAARSNIQEIPVATREESGVLGFPSRRGLTPRGSLECNPEIPAFPGEEN